MAAPVDTVRFIEPAIPKLDAFNDRNRIETQAEFLQAAPYSLDGTGIHVLIFDVGLIMPTHVDFTGRVHYGQDCPPGPGGGYIHTTHVAGARLQEA